MCTVICTWELYDRPLEMPWTIIENFSISKRIYSITGSTSDGPWMLTGSSSA